MSVDRIAIVSQAVRFPGSGLDLAAFWRNVAAAADCSTHVPAGRWLLPPEVCVRPGGPHPDSVAHARGYFLDPLPADPAGWNVPADLLAGLDPLFHLILDVTHRAWAGAKTDALDRRKVGVVLGNICLPTEAANALCREYLGGPVADALGRPREPKRTHPRNRYVAGLPAGLAAKALGLGGGTFTLDAACASSLYALKLACDELLSGRADAMLAGGLNRADSLYTQMGFSQLRALSPTGRCSPFDASADGLMVGEGAGVFVLKRLADAERDGDAVHGVVAGWGLSNDVAGNLLAPAVEGQLRAMRAAYEMAGWRPTDVDLIECHATGTPVGDAVEFDSLRQLWGNDGWKPGQCAIGSVKSTVGHLLTGAGSAAVAKVLAALRAGERPPQANFATPGDTLRYDDGPFRVLRGPDEWRPREPGAPRRTAVSGFGFGGVNAHLLIEEYIGRPVVRGVTVPAVPATEPIAVVGLSARFGPWQNLREFQEFVLGGGSDPGPAAKRNGWGLADRPSPVGYFIEEVATPLGRFRIPPKELEEMLPQQLLMLHAAAAALDDAGATTGGPDPRAGVFVGLGLDPNTTNYHLRWSALGAGARVADAVGPPLTADRTMGALGSIAASRVARAFGFGGPSFTVCSEETSAGRAVELAVRALRAGEIDRAVAGGVDLAGDPRFLLASAADRGEVLPGEGAAALVLKRLADAERVGDRVYAVIRGVGCASGGGANQPGPDAATVASAFLRACGDGLTEPATVGYLDAAGSGSPADDAPEAEALTAVLAATVRPYPLGVGAVRRQVGHAGAASAAAGLVKACLALHHRVLPPTDGVTAGCHSSREARYWLADEADGPRRAAVAATGADGSVVQVVLEEYAKTPATDSQPLGPRSEAVFAIEADTAAALADRVSDFVDWKARRPADSIEALARAWLAENPPDAARKRAITFVASSRSQLGMQLLDAGRLLREYPDRPIPDPNAKHPFDLRKRVFYSPTPVGPAGKLAFVFPGSGNQFPGMGRDLSARWPAVLHRQQAENRMLRGQYTPDRFWADAIPADTTAKHFLFGQVALGTLTSDILVSLGVRPDAMVGQSLGESAGLFGLRVWRSRDEMLKRVWESPLFGPDLGPPYCAARTALEWPAGEPLDWVSGVLPVAAEKVRAALRPGARAYLLIVTTPTECVVGGVRADVQALVDGFGVPFLELSGVTLAHCECGRPVEGPYRELHTLTTTRPPGLTVFSGARAEPYDPTSANAADSITAGLVGVIDFPAVVEAAYRDGVRAFVEVGPGNSATRMVAAILEGRPHLARAVTAPRQDAVSLVLRCAANLIAERLPADLTKLYPERPADPPASGGPAVTVPVGLPPRPLPRRPEPPPAAVHHAVPATVGGLAPFVAAVADTQLAAGSAHDAFLRVQAGFTTTAAAALQLHAALVARGGSGFVGRVESSRPAVTPPPRTAGLEDSTRPTKPDPLAVPRSLTTAQCFEFARGKIAAVLGPLFAEIDAHPTRVRLPDGPLMLVDRVLSIEGEPRSLTYGRVVTDHHVRADRWYLDAGRIPTCVAVEAGQADLFLSGFLGIDFETKGRAVYRLIDAVVTFRRGLPRVGDTIRYDIHIDQFIQQGEAWLFRFRFEATVGGEPLMSMTNGVAGFFTAEALASGQGIVHTKLDKQPMPGKKPADWRDFVPPASCSLGAKEVAALRRGDLAGAFGPDFARAKLRDPMKLPGGMLRLLDRVPVLDPAGGRFGLGFVRAEYDISPDDWFLTCHFVDDMVMPGTLMYECCLHTLRVLLMRLGWVGEDGEVATEPVPGISSRLKCRGQVIASTKVVAYEVSVKELGYGPEPFCVADALMYADGKPIVEITNMTLRMAGLTWEKLDAIWGRSPAIAIGGRSEPLYDRVKILAYAEGNPSEGFGDPYRVFDEGAGRVIARLPRPPFLVVDRVTGVTGEPFVLKAGAACVAEYDVPPDAWYFEANRCPRMPFSVLLEVALQPCGWLAAYCGSALTSDTDLSFRNLGGKATQYLPVGLDVGTLTMAVTMTRVSKSAGMVIQHYDMLVTCAAGKVYEGTTYFGFFTKDALANQVGMPAAKVPYLTADQKTPEVLLPADPPFPAPMLRMVDRIDGYLPAGGRAGLGLVQGSVTVDPSFWFFRAHFYQDPVWPGSLGLESFLQLLKYAAWKRWGDPPAGGWQTVAPGRPHEWTYRGQVLPADKEVVVVLEVTAADDAARRLTADGFLVVDGRVIYQMAGFTLE
jgi:acyl transferase domain-containing protein/3-hydroxymyristoyl/3-hydroxydecanoyl-(acyl carrier protein) dehydratase